MALFRGGTNEHDVAREKKRWWWGEFFQVFLFIFRSKFYSTLLENSNRPSCITLFPQLGLVGGGGGGFKISLYPCEQQGAQAGQRNQQNAGNLSFESQHPHSVHQAKFLIWITGESLSDISYPFCTVGQVQKIGEVRVLGRWLAQGISSRQDTMSSMSVSMVPSRWHLPQLTTMEMLRVVFS